MISSVPDGSPYSGVSELGRSLGPLFASLANWSTANLDAVEESRREYDNAAVRPSSRR